MKAEGATGAIIGCGVIGRSWAIVFARAGATVRLFDVKEGAAEAAAETIRAMLGALGHAPAEIEAIAARIAVAASLEAALDGADYAQESVAETVDAKRAVFAAMDEAAPAACLLASSCSSLPPDRFLAGLPGAGRSLIAHPFNPPHLIPIVELVPAAATTAQTIDRARAFLAACGQHPVRLKAPIPGFIGNRLQAALVCEAMNLIAEDAASPDDIDACLRLGLGLRWALMGPLETMDLNADGGVGAYIGKFGADYQALAQELGVSRPWTEEAVERATAARRQALPLDALPDRMAWRDRALLRIRTVVEEARGEADAGKQES